MKWLIKYSVVLMFLLIVIVGTGLVVMHLRTPGQLDVLTAQAMDMSKMRPPTGAALVQLATAHVGSLSGTLTYTGSIKAFNEQDITPRITGTITHLSVYPGDRVTSGELLAQLDASEVGARTQQAVADSHAAEFAAQVALMTHHLHHYPALHEASAQVAAAEAGLNDAQAQADSAMAGIVDANASVDSASANSAYWTEEIAREKTLADAGAVSKSDYQSETAQAQSAFSALQEARSKLKEAQALVQSSVAKVAQARHMVDAARSNQQMAQADLTLAAGQANQASAASESAHAAAKVAQIVESYTRILSPANGVVTERPIAPGALVQPGTSILRIAEIDQVRVQANVAVVDLGDIAVGSPVQITPQGLKNSSLIASKITSIFPSADDQTRTAVVEAVIPNPAHRLFPGGFATMRITTSNVQDGIIVPSSSLVSDDGKTYVWLAEGAKPSPQMYECTVCHMRFSAAQAAKQHYIDTMDGGKLVPVDPVSTSNSFTMTAHESAVTVRTISGDYAEVDTGDLAEGDQVISKGQAGLSDGMRIISVAYGADGPETIPTASPKWQNKTYRCEKCGMTYSAADAKRNNFIDPMDGGRLVPSGG